MATTVIARFTNPTVQYPAGLYQDFFYPSTTAIGEEVRQATSPGVGWVQLFPTTAWGYWANNTAAADHIKWSPNSGSVVYPSDTPYYTQRWPISLVQFYHDQLQAPSLSDLANSSMEGAALLLTQLLERCRRFANRLDYVNPPAFEVSPEVFTSATGPDIGYETTIKALDPDSTFMKVFAPSSYCGITFRGIKGSQTGDPSLAYEEIGLSRNEFSLGSPSTISGGPFTSSNVASYIIDQDVFGNASVKEYIIGLAGSLPEYVALPDNTTSVLHIKYTCYFDWFNVHTSPNEDYSLPSNGTNIGLVQPEFVAPMGVKATSINDWDTTAIPVIGPITDSAGNALDASIISEPAPTYPYPYTQLELLIYTVDLCDEGPADALILRAGPVNRIMNENLQLASAQLAGLLDWNGGTITTTTISAETATLQHLRASSESTATVVQGA